MLKESEVISPAPAIYIHCSWDFDTPSKNLVTVVGLRVNRRSLIQQKTGIHLAMEQMDIQLPMRGQSLGALKIIFGLFLNTQKR